MSHLALCLSHLYRIAQLACFKGMARYRFVSPDHVKLSGTITASILFSHAVDFHLDNRPAGLCENLQLSSLSTHSQSVSHSRIGLVEFIMAYPGNKCPANQKHNLERWPRLARKMFFSHLSLGQIFASIIVKYHKTVSLLRLLQHP
jgi:hypothetical protein